ncbi:LexA family transcriptional regulator [Citrobacter sedlakii]|uniref:HumD family translesion DNA polymerase n=1 Tax=Citrobacter TaxID=544 RepID=UPI001969A64E|nr:S24 family peptidase [Citrobacter sedlakii]MBM9565829.1 LexA family transcriptional regulator [Citrobacter sedlakii]HBL4691250.1 LexA family transcriptional regulator [Citrobacter sedlakii]HBL4706160.1 LexA family transcriptional regulator [Citrobacter sedlakii]HBL4720438.1 LexA family transcriptional regulator [Citrobacter sedlakii]HCA7841389.1 LexA family transcriptional regulator [Citrobacter sedlakii]
MGFPSPAADYVEQRISLDETLISKPSATYFMRAGQTYWREGIMSGALLVVDSSLTPFDGSLLVCSVDNEFRVKRYKRYPKPHLINLETGVAEEIPEPTSLFDDESHLFGVITYIINDARSGEFDDCPVM